MPALLKDEAVEKLARAVEKSEVSDLAEIYWELFPEEPIPIPLAANDIARHIREGLEAEEIVDLWNVMFPSDSNVWYDEGSESIRFNEEMVGYPD